MAELRKSRRYGKCLVEREIGRGARSIVYLAWHESLQIPVAVKVIRKESAEDEAQFSERFMREARIAAQLTHSNIVRVYDCGETDDAYYLVMEYVEGESCKDQLDQWGAFDWQRAVQIIRQVADGLNHAYRKGIIHRDLKPENIMIDSDGDARIADLGLAKQVVKGRASATAEGDVLGTPYYMSPEQVRSPSTVDFRSDIYSLGATLYHMVVGEVPFEAPTPYEIMTKHLNEMPLPPRQLKPDIPAELSDLILKAMAKRPEERFQSYGELIRALDALLGQPSPPELAAPAQPVPRRQPAGAREALSVPQPPELAEEEILISEPEEEEEERREMRRRGRVPAEWRTRPILAAELPLRACNVQVKQLGLVALAAYAFFLCGLYQLVCASAGIVAGVGVLVLMLAASAGAAYHATRVRGATDRLSEYEEVLDHIGEPLGRLCERLDLPTPQVTATNRPDGGCFAYSLFSRRATIDVPARWMAEVVPTDEECEACLAQCLAAVYAGDSDIRALLAAPVWVLRAFRQAGAHLFALTRPMSASLRVGISRAFSIACLVGACVAVALGFVISIWAGLLVMVLFGTFFLVAAFERAQRHAADAFAVQVLGGADAVRSLVVLEGLSGPEGHSLLMDCVGTGEAERWMGPPASPEKRRSLVSRIVAHWSDVEYWPSTLEMAARLFSLAPAVPDRLNRMAGLGHRRTWVEQMMTAAFRPCARLLGVSERGVMNLAQVAVLRPYALAGAVCGLAVAVMMGLLALSDAATYSSYVALHVLAGAVLGLVVVPHACRQAATVGRAAWGLVTSSLFFTVAAMIGISLLGGRGFSRLAMAFPVGFVLILVMAALAGALVMRLAPKLGIELRRPAPDARSKTAHTVAARLSPEQAAALRGVRGASEGTEGREVE